jgi:hypothetical protein
MQGRRTSLYACGEIQVSLPDVIAPYQDRPIRFKPLLLHQLDGELCHTGAILGEPEERVRVIRPKMLPECLIGDSTRDPGALGTDGKNDHIPQEVVHTPAMIRDTSGHGGCHGASGTQTCMRGTKIIHRPY